MASVLGAAAFVGATSAAVAEGQNYGGVTLTIFNSDNQPATIYYRLPSGAFLAQWSTITCPAYGSVQVRTDTAGASATEANWSMYMDNANSPLSHNRVG